MNVATADAPDAGPAVAKRAGVLIAVVVPVAFWIGAVAFASYALGRPIATAILVGCGLANRPSTESIWIAEGPHSRRLPPPRQHADRCGADGATKLNARATHRLSCDAVGRLLPTLS
jgi:hypothetical protein